MELSKLFEGFSERYKNIILFQPIFQLSQSKDPKYTHLNLMEIGVAVLLMMLERMLTGQSKISPEHINLFLQKLLKERYDIQMNSSEVNEFRSYLIDDKLRNGGRKFINHYMDLATGEEKVHSFDLITYDDFSYKNLKEKNLYLKLTQEGIELLFKTKEMFAEMQISITMLYFKQQLDKGMFSQALAAVEELKLQIQTQINTIVKYENDIRSNALTMFKRNELEKKYKDSYEQTKQEKGQLNDLRLNVDAVKANYIAGQLSRNERRAYDQVLRIEKELTSCIAKHELLFIRKFELLKTLTSSLQLLIENAFSKHLHFKQEILEAWVEKKINQSKARDILKAVTPIKVNKFYNPFSAYDSQYVKKKRQEEDQVEDTLDDSTLDNYREMLEQEKEDVYKKEMEALSIILSPLKERSRYFLSDIIKELKAEQPERYTHLQEVLLKHFLNISIKIHRSPYKAFDPIPPEELPFEPDENRMMATLGRQHPELEELEGFEVISTERVVEFDKGVVVTDYIIERKID